MGSDFNFDFEVTKTKATHNDRLYPVVAPWLVSYRLTEDQACSNRILGLPYASRRFRNIHVQDCGIQTVFFERFPRG